MGCLINAMSEESIDFVLRDFPATRYFRKFKLTTWHPKRVFDEPIADKLIAFIEWKEYIQEAPWNRYAHLSAVTETRISLNHIMETANTGGASGNRSSPHCSLTNLIVASRFSRISDSWEERP